MATTSKRRRTILDIPLSLDAVSGNQSMQVHAGLRRAILDGRLAAGFRLPSSRDLAAQLGVRRNAVVAAYEHLHSDGLVDARHGDGTFVTSSLPHPTRAPLLVPLAAEPIGRKPFALGRTLIDESLRRRIGAAMRRHMLNAPAEDFGYGDPRGSLALRQQIALHLAAMRGFRCDPDCIMVVTGTQQGLRLCAEALLKPGDAVWMEDPGYPAAQRTLRAAGLQLAPVPVDDEGVDVQAGLRSNPAARAAYVTPSHQFPAGVTMSMNRRRALIDWARASGAWILEDDYDSEFRYAGAPLTALAGIDGGDRVIYLGTFSKTLFAGLRLAYLVLPPAIVDKIVPRRASHDRFPGSVSSAAIAALMADGGFMEHIRRMRRRYKAARDLLTSTLTGAAGDALSIVTPQQGLHLLAYLPPGVPAKAAPAIRAAAGIDAWLVSETRLTAAGPEGFVLGFSGYEPAEIAAAAEALGREAQRQVRR